MHRTSQTSHSIPFDPGSSLDDGLHVVAALGGGPPHRFLVDTGSVGVLVPRVVLGPDYQEFDPSQDIGFGYVSSGNTYRGQWVKLPVVLGVPADWDGTGTYATATLEVFAVDDPADFDGGVLGIGFAIGQQADGGPARNPLLHLQYHGAHLSPGYIITTHGIEAGLTPSNTAGFATVALTRAASGADWQQPTARLALPHGFATDLPLLMDTGITEMLLFLPPNQRPPTLREATTFPPGVAVTITLPTPDHAADPALHYTFKTGAATNPMAPSSVEWRNGTGINTGRNVLAANDYLYDATAGHIGFRTPPT